jgi:hypothetical protein
MSCFLHRCIVLSDEGLPLDAAKPVGLEDLLELVLDDCLVDLCWFLKMPQVSELDSVLMGIRFNHSLCS